MTIWNTYTADYRAAEVARIRAAARSGDCASVVGLSGAGKSNLFGWLAHRAPSPPRWALVDCNRLTDHTPEALFRLIRRALTGSGAPADDEILALDVVLDAAVADGVVALLLDRFDAVVPAGAIAGNLRALRDARKFRLSLIFGTRHGLPPASELAELCHAHTIALGCLSAADAAWNVAAYAERKGLAWGAAEASALARIDEARRFESKAMELAHSGSAPALGALLMLYLGLRQGEVSARVARDIDDDGRVLWVPSGKTKNARRRL